MNTQRPCAVCQKPFFLNRTKDPSYIGKYCSRKCSGIGQRKTICLICRHCQKPFTCIPGDLKKGGGKACSQECARVSYIKEPIASRIEKYTDYISSPNGCYLWTGATSHKGYAILCVNRKSLLIHRFLLEQAKGLPPKDKPLACHTCKDTRNCINEEHLYWGSNYDNMQDMKKDGHSTCGEKSTSAKITEQQALHIKVQYWTFRKTRKEISESMQISYDIVRCILARRTWKHIPLVPHEMIKYHN